MVLDGAKIEALGNDELNRQLDFHREEDKKLTSIQNSSEKVPLKSHMKYKADRVNELKKAVSRYLSRLGGSSINQTPQTAPTDDETPTQRPDDTFYESDYHDDDI